MPPGDRPPLEPLQPVELIAPVRDRASLHAAVENGADAVYVAGSASSTGTLETGFDDDELQAAVDHAHVRGVRVLMALDDRSLAELLEVGRLARLARVLASLHKLGADGVLVRDPALRRAVHAFVPELSLHVVADARDQATDASDASDVPGSEGIVQDAGGLETLERVEELVRSGVTSLRIQGPVERAEHVAILTRAYRNAIDRALAGAFEIPAPEADAVARITTPRSDGAGEGSTAPGPTGTRSSSLGEVIESGEDWVKVKLQSTLRVKDAVSIVPGPENQRAGEDRDAVLSFQVTQMRQGGHYIPEAGPGEIVELMGRPWNAPGDEVYKTADIELLEAARETYEDGPHRTVPIELHASIHVGEPIRIRLVEPMRGLEVTHESAFHVQGARSAPLTEKNVLEQLNRLGEVPFHLYLADVELDENAFAPIRELNAARRAACEALERTIAGAYHREPPPDAEARREALLSLDPSTPG